MMGTGGSRALLCKSSSLIYLLPSFSSAQFSLRLKTLTLHTSSLRLCRRMATDASSSPSSLTSGDGTKPTASSPNGDGAASASASASSSISSSSSASSAIDFLSLCHRLKTTKRAGWVRRDVDDPESVADHMYRMGLMALIASDIPGVDRDKCIKMAIVHDIAEAIVGDITPADGIPKVEKSRREREALDHMCKLLGGGSRAEEVGDLWMEYEENASPEAKIVKDFDKVEMILQALEYENEQGKDLDEFFRSTAGKFQTETGKAWASEIASRRRKKN